MFKSTSPRRCTELLLTGSVVLLAVVTTGCLTAGAGRVKLIPGAQYVDIVRDSHRVLDCVRVRDVQVSDGIVRRERHRNHEGYLMRARKRLKNITAHEGGDTALIMQESSRLILEPPSYKWTIDAVIYQCTMDRAEAGS